MKQFTKLFLFFAFIGLAIGFPAPDTTNENAEELGDLFEGDMDLTPEQIRSLYTRNGLIATTKRWNNKKLHFVIGSGYTSDQKTKIRNALKGIEAKSCVRFVEHASGSGVADYVEVVNPGGGCSSAVGRRGGKQTLSLSNGCFSVGTIQHEFLHALGFYHMQSTHNRDNYVTIKYENIQAGKEHNFNKYASNVVTDFGVTYDYGSVMHYGPNSFSSNGKPTIVPKDSNASIGQRAGLSAKDFTKLNKMYAC